MNRRTIALILALTVTLALGASAATAESAAPKTAETDPAAAETAAPDTKREETVFAAAESAAGTETAAPDAAGTLSFGNIGLRMIENYYPMLALQEMVNDIESHDYDFRSENLRMRINEIGAMDPTAAMLSGNMTAYSMAQAGASQLRQSYDDLLSGETKKDDESALRQYRNAQNQTVVYGETLYLLVASLEAQDGSVARGLAKLDRSLRELRLREQLGQIPAMTVEQVENTRTQTLSAQKTLAMNREKYLMTLKSMVGVALDEPLTLREVPKVSPEQLAAMDLEADLVKAKEASYELFDAKKQIDDFFKGGYTDVMKAYGSSSKIFEVSQAKHYLQMLRYQYEDACVSFELNFRTLYAQVQDDAQVLSAKRAALAQQEKEYAASALKYEQGNISANALADAKDVLADAKDAVADAERELFSVYRSYTWAVDYGILNG